MLNKWIGIGRLTKDPELRYTNSGKAVCNFTLAAESGFGNKQSTEFIDMVAWQKTAENVAKYLGKGSTVYVEGKLEIRKNKKSDRTYVNPEVVVRNIIFLTAKVETEEKDAEKLKEEAKRDLDERRGKTKDNKEDEELDDSFDKEDYEEEFDEDDFDVPF